MKALLKVLFYYYQKINYSRKRIILEKKVKIRGSQLEGNNKVYEAAQFISSSLGKGSYVGAFNLFINSQIGRFCSIGPRVKTILGHHPSSVYVSTHPAFFSLRKQSGFTFAKSQSFQEFRYADNEKKISVIIGNDVWIGSDVLIIEGVRIGDGAIVAAGSVITKDVDPYTIVAGVPGKFIKNRFSPEIVEFLLQFKWWEKDDIWLSENVELFQNVESLFNKYKNTKVHKHDS